MAKETRGGFQTGVKDDPAIIDQSYDENSKESLAKQVLLLEEELKKEKKRAEMLNQLIEDQKRKYLWANPIESLELDQLEELLRACLALDADITMELERRINGVPKVMDLPQNATIQYISSEKGETSSSASTYDSRNFGTDVGGVVQGGGSSMSDGANAAGASKMKAKIDG